ncbi:MAG: hypothetical protein LBU32_08385 [Clostridiales bacterium]|jgi:hypothetical protein|nr:hypothetical protein [Clostridiales bacterium]
MLDKPDIHGSITRLDNGLEGVGETIRRYESDLAETKMQMETAKGEVDRPFPQEAEYQEKSEQGVLLNMPKTLHRMGVIAVSADATKITEKISERVKGFRIANRIQSR